jgi:integrase
MKARFPLALGLLASFSACKDADSVVLVNVSINPDASPVYSLRVAMSTARAHDTKIVSTEDQHLFPDPRRGVLSNKVLNRWYRDLADQAGVRRITSHGARHTAGSSYAVMGAGQKVIGALLGHSDSASTERYTHIAPSATTAMVEARWLRLGGGEGGV